MTINKVDQLQFREISETESQCIINYGHFQLSVIDLNIDEDVRYEVAILRHNELLSEYGRPPEGIDKDVVEEKILELLLTSLTQISTEEASIL